MAIRNAREKTGVQVVTPDVRTHYVGSIVAGTDIYAATTSPTFGTIATNKYTILKIGRYAFIDISFYQSTGGSAGAGGQYFYQLPTGLTADTNYISTNNSGLGGEGLVGRMTNTNGSASLGYDAILETNKLVRFRDLAGTANFGPAGSVNFSTPLRLGLWLKIPILEWATTETVAYGAGLATSTRPGLVSKKDKGSFTCAITGSTTGSVTIQYALVDGVVTLTVPSFTATSTAATSINLNLSNMPSHIRPVTTLDLLQVRTIVNGADTGPGFFRVPEAGNGLVQAGSSTAFPASGTSGWNGFSVSYTAVN